MPPEAMLDLARRAAEVLVERGVGAWRGRTPGRASFARSSANGSWRIRPDHARLVPSDDRFRIDLEALARMVAADRAAGLVPIAVCANAGATATGAVDPLDALADFCAAEGLWLHVDAAYGGFAILTERGKRLLCGIERADSVGRRTQVVLPAL